MSPPGATPPTPEQLFRRHLYLNGVTEPEAVARLWAAEKSRRREAEERARRAIKDRKRKATRG